MNNNLHTFLAYQNDTQQINLADLTIQNGYQQISIYGQLDIKPTSQDLQQLQWLIAQLNNIEQELVSRLQQPAAASQNDDTSISGIQIVKNPFQK